MTPRTEHRFSILAFSVAALLAIPEAHSAGFQQRQASVSAMSTAFASGAVAEGDAAVVAHNPAQLTGFTGTVLQLDASRASHDANFTGGYQDIFNQSVTGGPAARIDSSDTVPSLAVVHGMGRWSVGAMLSQPFGVEARYPDAWAGRYLSLATDVEVTDLTLSAAVEVIPERLSLGAGLVYSRAEVASSRAVDFGLNLFVLSRSFRSLPFARPQAADGRLEVRGDDESLGYVLGASLRMGERWTAGLAYRSEIDYDLRGTRDWTVPQNVRGALDSVPGFASLYQDQEASGRFTTPAIATTSLAYDVTPALRLMGTYAVTRWSAMDRATLEFDGPEPFEAEGWSDSEFMALGAEYRLNEAWTLRAGIARDDSPVSDVTRRAWMPDENRDIAAVGARWNVGEAVSIDLAYARATIDDARIGPVVASPYALTGVVESHEDIVGASIRLTF